MLVINDYPELKGIFWDWNDNEIDEETAFDLIEKRWAYIDQNYLTPVENDLLHKLADDYGHGYMLVA